jgi:hypothetical protein
VSDDNEGEYPGQRTTAYHEAGHAIAAIKCPDGCVEYIDICNRDENDEENGGTSATTRNADDAFRVYAGPWAEANLDTPSESVNADRVFDFLRANRDDWIAFQRLAGNEVGVSEWTQLHESLLFGDAMPPEYRPPQSWHEKAHGVLAPVWEDGEIQALAKQMLAPQNDIELSNGQHLEREEGKNRWWGSDYRRAPDGGEGLVGPPPPFRLRS